MRCPTCDLEVPAASRFCLGCGAAISQGAGAAATVTLTPPRARPVSSSSSTSADEGRFPAGSLLGERYRVLGLLGRGGMGEVYRATDLTLNQPVALKFLPDAAAHNERLLERFHGEVRIARQVSHPNVCRVYDIGKVDGSPYITMEYVDGEDLATLLRRIGRLPGDKAVEIARKLSAGLAAAHAKGVLHRDLKPSNIMIDGRGQVLIMDFGLAAIAEQIEGAEARNGTPAYMAPEQFAGRQVTARSDIYSLGLVLYEMFTGKRAFETRERGAPPSATSVVKDIDPAVEKLIQRCLDPDPAKRPASALAVARALPGGDPLAEALAAGDTPSPEMVAASEETGALSVRAAVLCLAFIVAGLIAVFAMSSRTNLLRLTPFPDPPDILARKARDLAVRFGYTEPPADSAHGFYSDNDYRTWAERNLKPDEYRAQIAAGQPPPVIFWYRQSPQYLQTLSVSAAVTRTDPPTTTSGMVRINLDPQGRLLDLGAVPPQLEERGVPAKRADWSALFTAAGLDPARFTPAEPQWLPLVSFDERAAWTSAYPQSPSVPLRVEAAAWKGRPVHFQMIGPWTVPARAQRSQISAGQRVRQWLLIGLLCTVILAAALLAWGNYRRGSGDLRGATRIAAFVFVGWTISWLLDAHHVPSITEVFYVLMALSRSLGAAALIWMLYLALEPYVRRRWPQSLISWTRLLSGGARDPLVGGHLLAGTALGIGYAVLFSAQTLVLAQTGLPPPIGNLELGGPGSVASSWVFRLLVLTGEALAVFFLLFLLRAILRRNWLAAMVFIALFAVPAALGSPRPGIAASFAAAINALLLWILMRFGVLPAVLAMFFSTVASLPFTTDFSAWYAGRALVFAAIVLALALWSFRTALGGRKLLKEGFLET